jgi:hypothetical protein
MCGVVVAQQIYAHGFLCKTILILLAKVEGMMDKWRVQLVMTANLLIGTDADTLAQSLDVPVRHVLECIYVEIDVGHFLLCLYVVIVVIACAGSVPRRRSSCRPRTSTPRPRFNPLSSVVGSRISAMADPRASLCPRENLHPLGPFRAKTKRNALCKYFGAQPTVAQEFQQCFLVGHEEWSKGKALAARVMRLPNLVLEKRKAVHGT